MNTVIRQCFSAQQPEMLRAVEVGGDDGLKRVVYVGIMGLTPRDIHQPLVRLPRSNSNSLCK